MVQPAENVIAAFPPSVKVGNVTLKPLTLGGAIRLTEYGIDTAARVPKEQLFTAAWILSGENDQKKFLRRMRVGLAELSNAVEEVLNTSCITFVKPVVNKTATASPTPKGLGWPLVYAEWLCAEYGWTWDEAMATPVARVYALDAACRERHGGKHAGLDYFQRQYRKDLKAGKVKPFRLDNGKEEAV